MKKIRILNISFDTEIKSFEVPAFRGAIIEKVGRESTLFHNHLDDTKYRYNYPLIQYKQVNRKPMIVCIEQGVDEIHNFFENRDWTIEISNRTLEMKIDKLNMNQFTLQVWDKTFEYNIRNWFGLNNDNYEKYNKLEGIAEKVMFLENLLKANILSLAKGIGWNIEKEIKLNITKQKEPKLMNFSKQKILCHNLNFKTNVFLPNYIGLGKGVSKGFGVIMAINS